jgi:Asp/Glu/hydantoin racemase
MAGVRVTIPGVAGIVEAKAALMAQAVAHQFNIVTAAPEQKVRQPSAGDIGKRLQTARLA